MSDTRPLPKGAILVPKKATKVFSGAIFDVYQWPQKLYDGSTATFEMLKRPDTVNMIAVVDGKIVLEQQEQPNKPKHFTTPAGRVDPGESPLEAARREMHEETGLTFAKWELKAVEQPYSKIEWFIYTFVAQQPIKQGLQRLDAGERIKISFVPYERIVKLVRQGELHWDHFLLDKILNGQDQLADIVKAPNFRS